MLSWMIVCAGWEHNSIIFTLLAKPNSLCPIEPIYFNSWLNQDFAPISISKLILYGGWYSVFIFQSYMLMLEDLKALVDSSVYSFYLLWPRVTTVAQSCVPLVHQFYNKICSPLTEQKLFSRENKWVCVRILILYFGLGYSLTYSNHSNLR